MVAHSKKSFVQQPIPPTNVVKIEGTEDISHDNNEKYPKTIGQERVPLSPVNADTCEQDVKQNLSHSFVPQEKIIFSPENIQQLDKDLEEMNKKFSVKNGLSQNSLQSAIESERGDPTFMKEIKQVLTNLSSPMKKEESSEAIFRNGMKVETENAKEYTTPIFNKEDVIPTLHTTTEKLVTATGDKDPGIPPEKGSHNFDPDSWMRPLPYEKPCSYEEDQLLRSLWNKHLKKWSVLAGFLILMFALLFVFQSNEEGISSIDQSVQQALNTSVATKMTTENLKKELDVVRKEIVSSSQETKREVALIKKDFETTALLAKSANQKADKAKADIRIIDAKVAKITKEVYKFNILKLEGPFVRTPSHLKLDTFDE